MAANILEGKVFASKIKGEVKADNGKPLVAKVILILILYNALTDYLIIFAEVIDLSR